MILSSDKPPREDLLPQLQQLTGGAQKTLSRLQEVGFWLILCDFGVFLLRKRRKVRFFELFDFFL
jgi:hypothetical protein